MLIITRRLLNYELTCGSSKIALFHSCERWCPERVLGGGADSYLGRKRNRYDLYSIYFCSY
eukprot:scaffold5143_cov139-Skeletonema_marinoi.AAC.4